MQRILFVDDEAKLLGGLRRMLHGMRDEWQMEFVENGPDALQRLAQQPFDVVVSDMRMPGMDGSELLWQVRERCPGTVRIVLSGQCDRREVLKAVGPAHQFLTKPCDSSALKELLARACRLRDRMTAPGPKELVSRVDAIAVTSESLEALTGELAASAPRLERMADIIAAEPGMAVRILQLVNSGFYGSPQSTVDPRQAARLLGQERLRELTESSQAFVAPPMTGVLAERAIEIVEHSRAVAAVARRIAEVESEDPAIIANAAWGGLLHDVGVLVFMQQARDPYADLWATFTGDIPCIIEQENRMFDADHAAVGAYLLALWGLPDSVVTITALHHAPSDSDDRQFTALTAVHAADVLTRTVSPDSPGRQCLLDHGYLDRIGKAERVSAWTALCQEVLPEGAAT